MKQEEDGPVTALVLQGGGALGAYQAGVYEALAEAGEAPDWVAGISIGAVNAAIIAGNPPEDRVAKLRTFWNTVSQPFVSPVPVPQDGWLRRVANETAANAAMLFGIPGFFTPRFPPAPFSEPGSLAAISVYDTSPLRQTLLDLVDFDRLNNDGVRFSVGAVNVLDGNFTYFDNGHTEIGPEHVMASGALPPGFPPVVIDGVPYWDGGIVSNTPLQYVLDSHVEGRCTVFQVDLFSARGALPRDLGGVLQREKDIRFSSRTRLNTDMLLEIRKLRAAARRLAAKLPDELKDDPDAILLSARHAEGPVTIMHLINRGESWESQSKDYEFSRLTVDGHWAQGLEDTRRSLADPRWINRRRHRSGIVTFDLARDHEREPGFRT